MKKKAVILFLLIFFISSNATTHPHIFFTNKIQALFDDAGLSGFKVSWLADDFSSAGLTDGYDENENGIIDKVELGIFEKDSVENLKQFQYFTHLKIDDKPIIVNSVNEFKASLIDGKIEYSFIVPCPVKATGKSKSVVIAQYDSSYFSFISFSEKKPVSIINGKAFQTEFSITESRNSIIGYSR